MNKILVLTSQVAHLHALRELAGAGEVFTGSTPRKRRESLLNSFKHGDLQVLYATYSLASEGLDVPSMTHIVLASPIKNRSRLTQVVGRVARSHPGKTKGIVVDFYDVCETRPIQSIFGQYLTERKRMYRANNYKVKEITK